jgi:hypothetical protein
MPCRTLLACAQGTYPPYPTRVAQSGMLHSTGVPGHRRDAFGRSARAEMSVRYQHIGYKKRRRARHRVDFEHRSSVVGLSKCARHPISLVVESP